MKGAGARVRLSVIATVIGWLAFILLLSSVTLFRAVFDSRVWANSGNPFVVLLLISSGSAVVVVTVWAVLVLPLAIFIKDRSLFWEPPVLTLIGAVAGPLIVILGAIYQIRSNPTIRIYQPWEYLIGSVLLPGIPSAIIGAVAGAVGAALHKRHTKTREPSAES